MIIYLVLNIAAGGGTFPVFSQNFLFQAISYLMPFRYAIEAEGAAIYGLGAGVNITSNA
jgi:putative membrane protein